MFIVSLHYIAPLEKIDQLLTEHVTYLQEQYRLGHFLLSGRKIPRTGGVIIARAENRDALDNILSADPFYRHQVAQYDITEIQVSKVAAGLESLLEPS